MKTRPVALDEIYYNFSFPPIGTPLSPKEAMNLACDAALQGAGEVQSNPLVGAVCVDHQHRFVEGAWHLGFGKAHAEQELILKIFQKKLERNLVDATIYSTLEPCAHVGKTPSCAQMLSELPLRKVVYGTEDRTEKASGKGPRLIKESGTKTELFCEDSDLSIKLRLLTEHFNSFEIEKKPFLAVKVASTLNGVFAHQGSSREWITCERSREYAHFLRLLYDAILVGADTVIQDNPSLDIRLKKPMRIPLRVVMDPKGRALTSMPIKEINLVKKTPSKTIWCLTEETYEALALSFKNDLKVLGLKIFLLKTDSYNKQISQVIKHLYENKIARILVEGGGKLWGEALNSGHTNKLYLFQAPKLFCREDIMHWTNEVKINYLNVKMCTMTLLEKDWLIEGLTNDPHKL